MILTDDNSRISGQRIISSRCLCFWMTVRPGHKGATSMPYAMSWVTRHARVPLAAPCQFLGCFFLDEQPQLNNVFISGVAYSQ